MRPPSVDPSTRWCWASVSCISIQPPGFRLSHAERDTLKGSWKHVKMKRRCTQSNGTEKTHSASASSLRNSQLAGASAGWMALMSVPITVVSGCCLATPPLPSFSRTIEQVGDYAYDIPQPISPFRTPRPVPASVPRPRARKRGFRRPRPSIRRVESPAGLAPPRPWWSKK